MATMRKRFSHFVARIPKIEFGSSQKSQRVASAVTTYYLVIIPALILMLFGLLMGFSAQSVTAISEDKNPYFDYVKPFIIIAGSFGVAFFVHKVPLRLIKASVWPLFYFAIFLQLLVLTSLGRSEGGNSNWIKIPGVSFLFQPSEFLKLALILALASTLTHPGARLNDWKQMAVKAGGLTAGALLCVLFGHDLGTALIVASGAFGAVWVAGLPKKWFLVLGGCAVPVLAFLVTSNRTRLARVMAILPGGSTRDLSAPEQIDHSLWAFGSGGLAGLGPGASREKWNYLQAAHTDFIFAIIGEEFGLIGTLSVLLALGLLVWGCIRVAQASTDRFVLIAASGIGTWIGIQAVVNIFSVTGVGPVIGVPLPLVSYGGSSFLFTAIAIGVVASFARAQSGGTMMGSADAATRSRDPRIMPKRRRVGGAQTRI